MGPLQGRGMAGPMEERCTGLVAGLEEAHHCGQSQRPAGAASTWWEK